MHPLDLHTCDCLHDSSTGVNTSDEGSAIPACIRLSSSWDSGAFCCGVRSFDACPMPGLRHRRSELKEQIQNDTDTRMTWTSGNTIRSVDSQMVLREGGGKLSCRRQTVSPCLGCLERKEVEGSVAAEKQWGRKIYWSLSPLSHLFPLPSAALAKLPDEFSYSQLLAFFFEVMLRSGPRWLLLCPCAPPLSSTSLKLIPSKR